MTCSGSVISCPLTLSEGNGPGGARLRWNALRSFQIFAVGVKRLNLDANDCQELVRSVLKIVLQDAAACLYARRCASHMQRLNCFSALFLIATAWLQAGVHHGADAFLGGCLLLGTLACAAEPMALRITEMSG